MVGGVETGCPSLVVGRRGIHVRLDQPPGALHVATHCGIRQRAEAVDAARGRARACGQQGDRRLRVAALRRQAERRHAVHVGGVGRRFRGAEQLDTSCAPVQRSDQKGRPSMVHRRHDVGTRLQQHAQARVVPGLGGVHERPAAVGTRRVEIGTSCEEHCDDLVTSAESRGV